MRGVGYGALGAAAVAVGLAVVFGLASHKNHVSKVDSELETTAHNAVRSLETLFARARTTSLIASRNPALVDFYDAVPGDTTKQQQVTMRAAGGPNLERMNASLLYLQELFPKEIGEACVIDRSGIELARAVFGKRAPLNDLSNDESGAPFFDGAFSVPVGEVFGSRPYVSGDTETWVIAFSTPFSTRANTKQAFYHYELDIESIRQELAASVDLPVLVIDRVSGTVVMDTRSPQKKGAPLGHAATNDTKAAAAAGSSSVVVNNRRAYGTRMTLPTGNSNSWQIVGISTAPAGFTLGSIGPLPPLLLVAALLLVIVGGLALRAARQRAAVAAAEAEHLARMESERRATQEEAARLGAEAQGTAQRLGNVLSDVSTGADRVSSAVSGLEGLAGEAGRCIDTIGHTVNALSQDATRQTEMVAETRTTARAGAERAEQGSAAAARASDAMRTVRATSDHLSEAVQSLSARSGEIGSIIATITDIADQTNLLALNAAIEAARAGEQGRGFAVVAEEVRKLAESSRSSAGSISSLISEIQTSTNAAVTACGRAAVEVDGGVATVEEAHEALESIVASMQEITAALSELDEIAQRTQSATTDVEGAARRSQEVVEETLSAAVQLAATAQELAALTDDA